MTVSKISGPKIRIFRNCRPVAEKNIYFSRPFISRSNWRSKVRQKCGVVRAVALECVDKIVGQIPHPSARAEYHVFSLTKCSKVLNLQTIFNILQPFVGFNWWPWLIYANIRCWLWIFKGPRSQPRIGMLLLALRKVGSRARYPKVNLFRLNWMW